MQRDRQRPPQKAPKKSQMLEVRLPHQTKQDFVAACQRAGRTASDVLREAVQTFIDADRKRPAPQTGKLIAMIPAPVRKRRYVVGAAAALALGAAVLLPSTAAAGPDFAALFQKMDRDGDGVLTQSEFRQRGAFNGDLHGVVATPTPARTQAEITRSEELKKRFAGLDFEGMMRLAQQLALEEQDRNGDGKVSLAEFERYNRETYANSFIRMDRNGDGYLDKSEVGPGAISKRQPEPDSTFIIYQDVSISADQNFARLDSDKDGKVSSDEFLARWLEFVAQMYTD